MLVNMDKIQLSYWLFDKRSKFPNRQFLTQPE